MASRTDNSPQGNAQTQDAYVDTLADLIVALISSATVSGTVATTGTAAAQTGTITSATIS
ncbi:hypothetical protein GCM10023185_15600 [Hymenobacter saemangeumensis]|uniref:Uncharacterized protein n=1 Tax=Hymenobacter saemangeumensis TaxID=1084522 RepID=A0ABP8I9E0_9BACT